MNKKALIAIGVLIIVIGGAVFWMLRQDTTTDNKSPESTSTTTQTGDSPAGSTDTSQPQPTGSETTITYSDSGYSPSAITVKTGDTVIIKNTSTRSMQFDSDPHPAHTTNPELNVNLVPAGESRSFVVDTKGKFGYHNHLNASQKGTIIVE